ncbi:MAG TPA: 16S rRNA (cytosine(1402)-N(4))-methyltransferase RsmH [Actinomycetota bacterium]|nr:16S rRNA (cytosine(1402)-N(4))-methyltransferase RsmH [Actinomycetota bacterium]
MHVPVLADAVTALLVPEPTEATIVDATLGAGGYAERILEAMGPNGNVIGIDRDEVALGIARERLARFGERVRYVHAGFDRLEEIVRDGHGGQVDGVVYDFGLSSMHVDDPSRGFSFRHDAPLDMRMDPSQTLTAADVLNTYEETELARIIRTYGEERWAARIASFIVLHRRRTPISTTLELVEIIRAAVPKAARRGGPHPARRTFQALRIEVNKELEQIEASLPQALSVTRPGGRLVAVSYHSLEDRIVKRFFRGEADGEAPRLRLIKRKPIRPTEDEIEQNPRASSAMLRAAEVLASPFPKFPGPEGSAA